MCIRPLCTRNNLEKKSSQLTAFSMQTDGESYYRLSERKEKMSFLFDYAIYTIGRSDTVLGENTENIASSNE